jgi:glycosyltransferase involved in cell wall biosynthesis
MSYKVIITTNFSLNLAELQLPLMKALRAGGVDVLGCSPDGPGCDLVRQANFLVENYEIDVHGTNPVTEAKTVFALRKIYKAHKPDLVQHSSTKLAIYGTWAARAAGVSLVVNTITGLGFSFIHGGLYKKMIDALWMTSGRGASWTVFQNPDDKQVFIDSGLVSESRSSTILGFGVDVQTFLPNSERCASNGSPMTFLCAGRMLWDKGIAEFVTAAAEINRSPALSRQGRFILLGCSQGSNGALPKQWTGNPASIPEEWIDEVRSRGNVECLPFSSHILPYIQSADVVVLPSYREGLPRFLLEGMSCEKAVITTDVPGCREVVRHRENGFLVEARSAAALVSAYEYFLRNPAEVRRMGRVSRAMVVQKFSNERVIDQTLRVYRNLGMQIG